MIAPAASRRRRLRPERSGIGRGSAPGTCGELIQGQFQDGSDFLVTLPVNLGTEARAVLTGDGVVAVWPPGKSKTVRAARLALDLLGQPNRGARIALSSTLPEGKGMASSTADIVAACRALAAATGHPLAPDQISAIAAQIEPSDGVMYGGCVCYNHRQGRLLEALGPFPPATLLVVDLGGQVDTVAFNRRPKAYTTLELETLERAYLLAGAGIREQSLPLLGRAATLSARTNQRLLPKPQLDTLVALADAHGVHGVCIAHSGTVAGLLFDRDAGPTLCAVKRAIRGRFGPALSLFTATSAGQTNHRALTQN